MPKGPCVICGAVDYNLSMGGPSICPACDCGIPPEVTKLKRQYAALEARCQELEYDNQKLRGEHDIGCDIFDVLIPGKPCNCYLYFKDKCRELNRMVELKQDDWLGVCKENDGLKQRIAELEGELAVAKAEIEATWDLAHSPAKCGHARANWKDPKYGTPDYKGEERCEVCEQLTEARAEVEELKLHCGKCAQCGEYTCGFCGISNSKGFWHCSSCHRGE